MRTGQARCGWVRQGELGTVQFGDASYGMSWRGVWDMA